MRPSAEPFAALDDGGGEVVEHADDEVRRACIASYRPGTVVLFRSNDDEHGLLRDTGYRVDAIDPSANTLRLLDPDGQASIWNPGQSGADQAEAYVEVAQEF